MVLDKIPNTQIFTQRDVRETPISTATASAVGLTDGKYLVVDYHADMTDERKITAGEGIDFNDSGANSTFEIKGENATLTNKGVVELATIAETQTGTSEALAVCPNSLFEVLVPVGAIIAWAKTMTGVPATLPTSFVECDGSVISDAASPMDGQTLPDLNGNEFLRGAATSGGTGGGTSGTGSSHTHSVGSHTHTGPSHTHTGTASGTTGSESSHTHSVTCNVSSEQVAGSGIYGFSTQDRTTGSGSSHSHSFSDGFTTSSSGTGNTGAGSGNTGSESAHTHASQPKYYNVVWIMRIK